MIAEVYPTLAKFEPESGRVKGAQQVESPARLFAARDRSQSLEALLKGPESLTADQKRSVEDEEGWILGVL